MRDFLENFLAGFMALIFIAVTLALPAVLAMAFDKGAFALLYFITIPLVFAVMKT